jgi:hypothetical protein
MFSRRISMAMLLAMLISALTVAPAAAAKPAKPPPAQLEERPLTPEEQAAADAKAAAAAAYLASPEGRELPLMSLACVTPTGSDDAVPAGAVAPDATLAGTDATVQACYTPQAFLTVYARDQQNGIYCGPAVGQVISNYSWAVSSTANKFSQDTIAGWMATNVNGGTNAFYVRDGLARGTAGSPRQPANWAWVVANLGDWDHDGSAGDELHGYLRSNVSGSKMPLAIPVKPYEWNAQYHLSSWARPKPSPGHWIAAYGWVGYWTGTDYARLYYTDSSRDEGGSTGKYWDPTRHIAAMVMVHTARFVW